MNDFPNKIRRIVEDSDLSVEEFAHKIGVTRNVIYNIYRGQYPSIRFIISMVNVFPDIDLNWLLKEEKELDPTSIYVQEEREGVYANEDQHILTMAREHLQALEDIILNKKEARKS